jgi:hypothetical protein
MKYKIGTKFIPMESKVRRDVHSIVDFHVTRNMCGEIVKERYVTSHLFMGQNVIKSDIPQSTIDRAEILKA